MMIYYGKVDNLMDNKLSILSNGFPILIVENNMLYLSLIEA